MNKTIKKAGILAAVFVAAVVFYFVFSREQSSQQQMVYGAMGEAELPVVSVQLYGYELNPMHGYVQDMGNAAADSLTVLPKDRALPIWIAGCENGLTSIRYEIRTMDLERLVEDTALESWEQEENGIRAVLPIQNLLNKEQEYLLRLILDTADGKTVSYYTRILWTDNQTAADMLHMATDFSAKTFDSEQAGSLTTYLEVDDTEDNSSLGHTTIHSSFSQLTWGKTRMQPPAQVQVTLKELDGVMAVVELQYVAVRQNEEQETEYYEVDEDFTMKWDPLRIYLMEYERNVNQIFTGDPDGYSGKRIMLGITNDSSVSAEKSSDGNILAFRSNRDLWSYNEKERQAVKIFSFRSEEAGDVRNGYDQHDVQILHVENNGDVDFLVYGYMNRGVHEGQMGIASYHYDSSANALEEKIFISTSMSFERIQQDLSRLAVKTGGGMLYLYLDHAIYGIDLQSREYVVVADGLREGNYAVSAGKERIAWMENGDSYGAPSLNLMKLETGETVEIHGEAGGLVRPLGFVGEDLVYGLAREEDLWMENGRVLELPMYALEIMSDQLEVETRYEKAGFHICDVSVEESRIYLTRAVRQADQSYVPEQDDTIVCNAGIETDRLAGIGWYASQDKGKLYFAQTQSDIKNSRGIKMTAPRRVGRETEDIMELKANNPTGYMEFYAYGGGHLLGSSSDFTTAMQQAYEHMGVVKDSDHRLLWGRVNRSVTGNIREPVTAFLPVLNRLGEFSDSRSYSDGLVLLNARGSSVPQILYFIDQGIPVAGYTDEGSYLLLSGYDSYNVTICDPATGEISKVGINDCTEYFRLRGNDFVCALANP